MLALTETANGSGLMALRDKDRPRARPGTVVLDVASAGLCGTDVHILEGEYAVVPPVTIGHEVCGRVCEVGDGVDAARIEGGHGNLLDLWRLRFLPGWPGPALPIPNRRSEAWAPAQRLLFRAPSTASCHEQ